jgi:hypothetical protein
MRAAIARHAGAVAEGRTIAGGSNAQCEQFDGANPKHENCERYWIVFEPNTHDTPHIANRPDPNRIADDGYSTTCRQNGSLRLRARYRLCEQ